MKTFDILTFGAQPETRGLATGAIRAAVQACVQSGGGVVYVPPGRFRCAPFELASNVTLYLEAGAVLTASDRLEDYPLEEEKLSQESLRAGLVTAHGAENVAIAGRGIIDGNALAFLYPGKLHLGAPAERTYARQREGYNPDHEVVHGPLAHGERPGNLVRFHQCRNVELRGVTICNAPTWTVHFKDCEDVLVHGARINSPGSDWQTPNDDGIDLENCARVRISDCDIDTGDDCIAIFGSHSVAVTNSILRSRSAGIRVNYDIGHAHDLVFSNLVIEANRGVTMMCRGEAVAENVLFSNLIIKSHLITGYWWGHGEPIVISAVPGTSNPLPPGQAPFNQNKASFTGWIRNVRFKNIVAEGEQGIVLYGWGSSRLKDIHIENLHLTIRKGSYQATLGGNFDLRPAADPAMNLFEHDIPAIYARHVDGLSIRGLRVDWEENLPDYFTHALQVEDFDGLRVEGFEGRQAQPDTSLAAIQLRNGRGVSISGCRAVEGTGIFLALEGVEDQRLFHGNDVLHARQAIFPESHFFRGYEKKTAWRR